MSLEAHNYDTARVQGEIAAFLETVGKYERSPATFDPEECRRCFERVRNVILLCTSVQEARLVDAALMIAYDGTDPSASDLRFITTHLLIFLHRFYADQDRGADQSYVWSRQVRTEVESTLGDYELVRQMMIPRICKPGGLAGHLPLARFFLEQVAEYENAQGSPVMRNEEGDKLLEEPGVELAYQLVRRYCDSKGINLVEQEGSLEQQYRRDKSFRLIEQRHATEVPLLPHLIEAYDYARVDPFLVRLRRGFANAFRGLTMRLAGPYIEYELTRRNAAFAVHIGAVVVYLLLLAIGLYGLNHFHEQRMAELNDDSNELLTRIERIGNEASASIDGGGGR